MEAVGKIYSIFPYGYLGVNNFMELGPKICGALESALQDAGFKVWVATNPPKRTFISYGGLDDLRDVQGIIAISEGRVYATGKDLIVFMNRLDRQEIV
ncbi:MAG: hypothetical protein Q8R18_02295 [bacterium]|nr:hypothetical protein [bacterium]